MNKNTRWALALVGVAILIIAAVVITTNDDGTDATQQNNGTEQPAAPTASTGEPSSDTGKGDDSGKDEDEGSTEGTGGASPEEDSGGARPDDNSGTGGASASSATLLTPGTVKKITTSKGDTVYLKAKSPTADELHIHGYDHSVDLPAGKTVSYKFKADIDGEFEIEFEKTGVKAAVLKVNP